VVFEGEDGGGVFAFSTMDALKGTELASEPGVSSQVISGNALFLLLQDSARHGAEGDGNRPFGLSLDPISSSSPGGIVPLEGLALAHSIQLENALNSAKVLVDMGKKPPEDVAARIRAGTFFVTYWQEKGMPGPAHFMEEDNMIVACAPDMDYFSRMLFANIHGPTPLVSPLFFPPLPLLALHPLLLHLSPCSPLLRPLLSCSPSLPPPSPSFLLTILLSLSPLSSLPNSIPRLPSSLLTYRRILSDRALP